MKAYCLKLWDNSCTFVAGNDSGFIGTFYVSAKDIPAAIAKVKEFAKENDYSPCRVVDVCEIEHTII